MSQQLWDNAWSTESKIKRNSKAFWAYINTVKKENGIPENMYLNNSTSHNDLETAQLFSMHFASVYVANPQNPYHAYSNPKSLTNLKIDSDDIGNALSALKDSSSPGPDYIPALFILKQCSINASNFIQLFSIWKYFTVGYGCLYWLFSLDDVLLPDSKDRRLHRGLGYEVI